MINKGTYPAAFIERFETLYEATHRQLFSFVRINCRQSSMVEDIVQECYIKIWAKLEQLQDDEKLLTLLRLYAKSLIIDHLRKDAKARLREISYTAQQDVLCYADTTVIDKELATQYRQVIDEMPPQRRRVYLMVRERGLSHQQVSELLNISIHTIERHMNDAMQNLKKRFPAVSNSL